MNKNGPLKVLFINPPTVPYNILVNQLSNRYSTIDQIVSMPMGILYLASVLERDFPSCDIRIVDLAKAIKNYNNNPKRKSPDVEEFTTTVLNKEISDDFVPDFIGISILFSTADKTSRYIALSLKKRWSKIPIIVGGMHATNAVEQLLSSPDIDFICRGEGEAIISDLAKSVIESTDLNCITGLIGKSKLESNKEKALSESAPLINNLDTIPFPAWHLIPMSEYVFSSYSRAKRLDAIVQDGEATILTTRGCPFKCTFCASWTVHGRKMRYRSTENILKELEILKNRYKIAIVTPEDDLFSVKKSRIIDLAEAITKKFGKSFHFQFPNGLSVATLDEEVIDAMAKMGMQLANIAIESGSDFVQRKIIKKNCNLERAKRVVKYCRDKEIITRAYFILGFPGETMDMMQETIEFAKNLSSDWNIFSIAAPLIGTEMYDQMQDKGWIDQSFNWDDAIYNERTFDTPAVKGKKLKDMAYRANIETNFFYNYNLMNGHYNRALNLYNQILLIYPGHLIAQYCIGLAYKKLSLQDKYIHSLNKCKNLLKTKSILANEHIKKYSDYMPELSINADFEKNKIKPMKRKLSHVGV